MSRRWRLLLGERLDDICYLDPRDFRQARLWGIARFPKAPPVPPAPEQQPVGELDSREVIELEIDGELVVLKVLDD